MSEEIKKAAYHIYIVSDATGETAETVMLAALSQFKKKDMIITRISNVRTEEHIQSIVKDAVELKGLIVHTLVSERLRRVLREEAYKYDVLTIDIIGPILDTLTSYLGKSPQAKPGLIHKTDELFFITQQKIVGLIVDPEKLSTIRKARLRHLGQEQSNYADIDHVSQEVIYGKVICRRNKWPLINVTNRAVEEVASEILTLIIGKDRRVE